MSPPRNDSVTTASYVLILGSLLTIIPNIPVINEYLPIVNYNSPLIKAGTNFLGTFVSNGIYQSNIQAIKGWTLLGLDGQIVWLLFVAIGVIGLVVGLVLKTESLIKMFGVIGGIIDLILSVLIFIGNSRDVTKYGLSNFISPNSISIGLGFWLISIGSIVILVSGLMLLRK